MGFAEMGRALYQGLSQVGPMISSTLDKLDDNPNVKKVVETVSEHATKFGDFIENSYLGEIGDKITNFVATNAGNMKDAVVDAVRSPEGRKLTAAFVTATENVSNFVDNAKEDISDAFTDIRSKFEGMDLPTMATAKLATTVALKPPVEHKAVIDRSKPSVGDVIDDLETAQNFVNIHFSQFADIEPGMQPDAEELKMFPGLCDYLTSDKFQDVLSTYDNLKAHAPSSAVKDFEKAQLDEIIDKMGDDIKNTTIGALTDLQGRTDEVKAHFKDFLSSEMAVELDGLTPEDLKIMVNYYNHYSNDLPETINYVNSDGFQRMAQSFEYLSTSGAPSDAVAGQRKAIIEGLSNIISEEVSNNVVDEVKNMTHERMEEIGNEVQANFIERIRDYQNLRPVKVTLPDFAVDQPETDSLDAPDFM